MKRQERMDITILNRLAERIVGAAFAVHTALGPGLLESAYEACLEHELRSQGLMLERDKALPVDIERYWSMPGTALICWCRTPSS